jgi:hypothetical protein
MPVRNTKLLQKDKTPQKKDRTPQKKDKTPTKVPQKQTKDVLKENRVRRTGSVGGSIVEKFKVRKLFLIDVVGDGGEGGE